MQSILQSDVPSVLAEVYRGQLPPEIAQMLRHRHTTENVMRELLTGVPTETREAIAAMHDLHQEDMALMLAVIHELHQRA